MQVICRLETVPVGKVRLIFEQQILKKNRLKPLIKRCLLEDPARRPAAEYICEYYIDDYIHASML